jgi:hypothetical protein
MMSLCLPDQMAEALRDRCKDRKGADHGFVIADAILCGEEASALKQRSQKLVHAGHATGDPAFAMERRCRSGHISAPAGGGHNATMVVICAVNSSRAVNNRVSSAPM